MPSYPGRPPVNNWGNWLACRVRSKIDARKPMGRTGVELHGRFRPLTEVDLPLIVISRNERRLIDPFLEHYRRLGVTRFLWLDDRSADGSREILTDQADVDLLASNVSYREAHRGRLWREMIIDRYGRNRWYVMVDTDEFLVFADCEILSSPNLPSASSTRV